LLKLTEIYQKKLQVRIYITVLLSLILLFFSSACKRSGISNTSNPKNYQNNASAGSSRHRQKKDKNKEQSRTKEEKHKTSTSSDQTKKLIKTARSYTGTPYKFGGTSRSGLDCSGLTSITYQAIDITLPRTSQSQSAEGISVKIGDIQPGDLVFFSASKNSKKITHVGMVTEVDGASAKFIHASTQLGVVENELLSGYYYPLIVKVRRVL
jgi:probable lipoprotein NlpC